MSKRKHVRTRFSSLLFSKDFANNLIRPAIKLEPGLYRIQDDDKYLGSFIVKADHTVEFYGYDLTIRKATHAN